MNELQEEEEKLRKIINIVRPTTLPELINPQVEDNASEVEQVPKINATSNNTKTPTESPVSIEIKKIDQKVKPNVEEKVSVVISEEKNDLKEAEGTKITEYMYIYMNILC